MKRLFRVWLSLVVTCLLLVCLEGKVVAQSSRLSKAPAPPAAAQTAALDCDAADVDGDNHVGATDLIAILLAWHTTDAAADIDGNNYVNVSDLIAVLECYGHDIDGENECYVSNASFQNYPLEETQDGTFIAQFEATPLTPEQNTIMALSAEAGSNYPDFAVLVRFIDGVIDARNGGAYEADVELAYVLGETYTFRLEVDIPNKVYDVRVTPEVGPEVLLANDYAFRESQANVDVLSNFGIISHEGEGEASVCMPQILESEPQDDDDDGVPNSQDNCPLIPNGSQTDSNGDGEGDACEAECDDGVDNDSDGDTDLADPGCFNADDDSESPNPQCSDGVDNDGDGATDLVDEGCTSPQDNSEGSEEVPVISSGSGWTGGPTSTIEPGPVGSPSELGYDAKVIGHFDVIPFQTITGDFEFGVVAFHTRGIQKVLFAANQPGSGPNDLSAWTEVTEMTYNPRTNVHEYWAMLQASDFEDGPVEVRVIAYPNVGKPRLLSLDFYDKQPDDGIEDVFHGCPLMANAGGDLPSHTVYVNSGESIYAAAQQIQNIHGGDAGGGTIFLRAGNHTFNGGSGVQAQNRWLTIAADPDATGPVTITQRTSHMRNALIKLEDLIVGNFGAHGVGDTLGLWANGIEMTGPAAQVEPTALDHSFHSDAGGSFYEKGLFVTHSSFTSLWMPVNGADIQRGVTYNDIRKDLFKYPRVVIDVQSFHHGYSTGAHADFVQFGPALPEDNILFYNVVSKEADDNTQGFYIDASPDGPQENPCGGDPDGIFGAEIANVAFINVHIDKDEEGCQFSSCPTGQVKDVSVNHFLLWNVTHDNMNFRLNNTDCVGVPEIRNLSVQGNVWDEFGSTYWPELLAEPSNQFISNHYQDVSGFPAGFSGGDDVTIGDPLWMDSESFNYTPAPDSPLRHRVSPPLSPTDAEGELRNADGSGASLGAFE